MTSTTSQIYTGQMASFRDPGGCVVFVDGRIIRLVNDAARADLSAFLQSRAARKLSNEGTIVRTEELVETDPILSHPTVRNLASGCCTLKIEHEPIPFPSFPYEWAPEMLHCAAVLTLELSRELLDDDFGLKDGTPYNILFRGPDPVFVDLLSFERRDRRNPVWLPYAQFIRTFLLPLLVNKHFGIPLDQIFTTRRDGLEPEEVYRWSRGWQRFSPTFLSLVSVPVWLSSHHDQKDTKVYWKHLLPDPQKARFIYSMLLKRLERSLGRVAPSPNRSSCWSNYMNANINYSVEHFCAKQEFVRHALEEFRPQKVLDVGCNTGTFSVAAARGGAEVVAIDYDPVVVGRLWTQAHAEKLNVLPLVVNLTRPTPPIGWRNCECASFLDRARGSFDCVLMLAVIHHMLVSERVPLQDIVALASELTRDLLVIEFVGPEDSMFRRLTRGRGELHQYLTPALFEELCSAHFEILRQQHKEGTHRWLYLLRKRR